MKNCIKFTKRYEICGLYEASFSTPMSLFGDKKSGTESRKKEPLRPLKV